MHFARFRGARFLHGAVFACINMFCAVLQYILRLQPFALGFVFSFSSSLR